MRISIWSNIDYRQVWMLKGRPENKSMYQVNVVHKGKPFLECS